MPQYNCYNIIVTYYKIKVTLSNTSGIGIVSFPSFHLVLFELLLEVRGVTAKYRQKVTWEEDVSSSCYDCEISWLPWECHNSCLSCSQTFCKSTWMGGNGLEFKVNNSKMKWNKIKLVTYCVVSQNLDINAVFPAHTWLRIDAIVQI